MSVPAPHFLLYSEAAVARHSVAGSAATQSRATDTAGRWRFILRVPGGETSLEAADEEEGASAERLELLAIVRGLEALDQRSRVTLVTAGRHLQHGLRHGLAQWRESDWHWERYGQMTPVKNADLWQRLDRLLEIHTVECRPGRLETAHDLAPLPSGREPDLPAPRWLRGRRGRLLRIDPAPAKTEIGSRGARDSGSLCRNDQNAARFERWNFRPSNLFRMTRWRECPDFVLRILRFIHPGSRTEIQLESTT